MTQSKRHLRSTRRTVRHPAQVDGPSTGAPDGSVRTVTARVRGASPVDTESLVTWNLGGGHFVIRSVPVVATHLTHGDIVSCSEHDGMLVVDDLVLHGGGTTVRLLVDTDHAGERPGLRERLAGQLIVSGCVVERIGHHLLAVGVGPDVDAGDIGTLCDAWEDAGVVRVLP